MELITVRKWLLWLVLLIVTCSVSAVTTAALVRNEEQPQTHATYQQSSSVIYMAHCDESGHYQLVTTTSENVATSEQRLGFWPIPAEFYSELSSNLGNVACVPGPMDSPNN